MEVHRFGSCWWQQILFFFVFSKMPTQSPRSTEYWLLCNTSHYVGKRKCMYTHPAILASITTWNLMKLTKHYVSQRGLRNFEKQTASNFIYSDIRYVLPLTQRCHLHQTNTHFQLEVLICVRVYGNIILKQVVCGKRDLTGLTENEYMCWSLVTNSETSTRIAQKAGLVNCSGNNSRIHTALVRGSRDAIIWH